MTQTTLINYLECPAHDFAATRQFFSLVFGWQFTDYGPDYLAFSHAGVDGGFYRSPQVMRPAQGSALIVLYSPNLEQIQQAICAAGGQICRAIFAFPGGRRFHFTDPNGNEFAVWSDHEAEA